MIFGSEGREKNVIKLFARFARAAKAEENFLINYKFQSSSTLLCQDDKLMWLQTLPPTHN